MHIGTSVLVRKKVVKDGLQNSRKACMEMHDDLLILDKGTSCQVDLPP